MLESSYSFADRIDYLQPIDFFKSSTAKMTSRILSLVSLLLLQVSVVRGQNVYTSTFINCGTTKSFRSETSGINWNIDSWYNGATTAMPPPPKKKTLLSKIVTGIIGTKTKSLPTNEPYTSYRAGKNITYNIPVDKAPKKYNVTLLFYEPVYTTIGQRKMTIQVEGLPAIKDFDIMKEASGTGGSYASKTVVVQVVDGILNITISSDTESVVSAISVQAYSAVRIRAGLTDYTDTKGQIWKADGTFANGGSLWGPTQPQPKISKTMEDPLYQMERHGEFQYEFWGLNNAIYTVRLHFSELFFTRVGARVFNVLVQNKTFFENVDILNMTNGTLNQAVVLQKSTTVKNGVLTVDLKTIVGKNLPKICAVEIL